MFIIYSIHCCCFYCIYSIHCCDEPTNTPQHCNILTSMLGMFHPLLVINLHTNSHNTVTTLFSIGAKNLRMTHCSTCSPLTDIWWQICSTLLPVHAIHCFKDLPPIPHPPSTPTSQKQEHPTVTTFLKNINLLLKYICRLCVKKDVHIHTLAHKLCRIFHQTEKENNFCKVKNLNTQAFICMLTVSNHLTAELIKENIPPPNPHFSFFHKFAY